MPVPTFYCMICLENVKMTLLYAPAGAAPWFDASLRVGEENLLVFQYAHDLSPPMSGLQAT